MPPEPFDPIANRIREAADQLNHPFDETAWARMEARLDEQEDRKRPFIWFFPLLVAGLLGVGLLFWRSWPTPSTSVKVPTGLPTQQPANAVNQPGNKHHTDLSATEPVKSQQQQAEAASTGTTGMPDPTGVYPVQDPITAASPVAAKPQNPQAGNVAAVSPKMDRASRSKQVEGYSQKAAAANRLSFTQASSVPESDGKQLRLTGKRTRKSKARSAVGIQSSAPESAMPDKLASVQAETDSLKHTSLQVPATVDPLAQKEKAVSVETEKVNPTDTVQTKAAVPAVAKQDVSKQPKQRHGWYVLGASGVEMNSVKFLSAAGAYTVSRLGAGVGYRINNRVSIQAGLFYSNKKYDAGPADYKLDDNPYWTHVQLLQVNARCRMYEVPLEIKYDWLIRKNSRWFATAGLGSYFIRREDYHYQYKKYNNVYESDEAYTGNKAIFSIVTLSAGWERPLNQRVSGFAQTLLRIPLGGVGDGSVKLHSFGLQVGLSYRLKK
jgi:hypothetical protein